MPRRPIPTPPAGSELLLGRLLVRRPRGSAPYLLVEGHCPGCGRKHTHGWSVEYGLDGMAHKAAHCGDPTTRPWCSGYHVALDPSLDHASQAILDRFLRRR